MPRLDLTSTMQARMTPEARQILALLTELVNDVRVAVELPPVTADEIETRLRTLGNAAARGQQP